MALGSSKVVYVALLGNLGVAISKFGVAAITGSAALMAEAFHSSADTANELLLLIGQKRSKRPPDEQHPFGHGKALYFWAFIVAMSVFAVGGGLSIYEGVTRLFSPEPLRNPLWDYIVLGVAALFEGYSWNYSRRELNRRREPGENLWDVIHGSKDPSIFSVFIEDSAALLGLLIAFFGVLLSHIFQIPQLDAAASVLIGLLLCVAAIALGREVGGLLVGEAVDPDELKRFRHIIRTAPHVEAVGDVLTMQLGPDEILLVADVRFADDLGTRDLEGAIDEIEKRVRSHNPAVKRIFFEAESLKKDQSRAA